MDHQEGPSPDASRILVVNGPNLDQLGKREIGVYGTGDLNDLLYRLGQTASGLGIDLESFQSNDEAEIIEVIHDTQADGIIINPGALTHTSHAIADAIRGIEIPVVEVHISNIHEREQWRSTSLISDACVATIYGRGTEGYTDAIRHLANRAALPLEVVRYGPHTDNVGDVRIGEAGLVVLVHGGVWRHQYKRDTIESLAVDLTKRGYHTWNIGYRLFGTGGGWPGSGQDVLMALDFAPQLDLGTPVAIVGHSAGGYLSMWAAPRTKTEIALCVGLAPVVDLDDAVRSEGVMAHESRLLRAAGAPSPVNPSGVPTILVHGAADDIVPLRHSKGLAERAGLELLEIEGGHFELLDPSKPHWEWVVERLP